MLSDDMYFFFLPFCVLYKVLLFSDKTSILSEIIPLVNLNIINTILFNSISYKTLSTYMSMVLKAITRLALVTFLLMIILCVPGIANYLYCCLFLSQLLFLLWCFSLQCLSLLVGVDRYWFLFLWFQLL